MNHAEITMKLLDYLKENNSLFNSQNLCAYVGISPSLLTKGD
jgi:hypothetical protein